VVREVEEFKMEMKLLSSDKGEFRFLVKDISPAELNAFRRIIINHLPSMAVDTVEILDNSSALFDEIIAQRIGLVVLKTDIESYFVKEKCKCKGAGCARCTLDLSLEAQGPCIVTADMFISKDPAVVPVHGKTPIVKLLENQSLRVVAHAILSTGKDHIKYSPGLMYYQGNPSIKIGNVKNVEEIVEICPRKVFELEGKKLKVKNNDACVLCNACVDASGNEIEVKGSGKDFIVTIEPWGQLTALEIVEGMVDSLHEQIDELSEEIKKLK